MMPRSWRGPTVDGVRATVARHAFSARDTAAAALDDLDAATRTLTRAYAEHGATLASAGLDVWPPPPACGSS